MCSNRYVKAQRGEHGDNKTPDKGTPKQDFHNAFIHGGRAAEFRSGDSWRPPDGCKPHRTEHSAAQNAPR